MFKESNKYRVRSGAVVAYDVYGNKHVFAKGTVLRYQGKTDLKPMEYWFARHTEHYNFHLFCLCSKDPLGWGYKVLPYIVPVVKMIVKEHDTKDQKFDPYDNGPLLMFEPFTEPSIA